MVALFLLSSLNALSSPTAPGFALAASPPPAPTVLAHTAFGFAGTTTGSSASFLSHAGDTIVVVVVLYGSNTVRSVTDSASDGFVPLVSVLQSNANGVDGLSIWAAYGAHGGPSVTATVTIQGSSTDSTAVGIVDATAVGGAPLDRLGTQSNSTPLAGSASKNFSNRVPVNASDLVLTAVGARYYDGLVASGIDSPLDRAVSPLSGRYMTMGDFQYTTSTAGSVWMNGTGNKSTNWIADSLTLKGAAPTPVTYSATFSESGLASGTVWNVNLNGTDVAVAAPNSVVFSEVNGSYPFSVGSVGGLIPNPASGSLVVAGIALTTPINFTAPPSTFAVNFTESGLSTGTHWSVTLNGSMVSAIAPNPVVFSEANGTYAYAVGSLGGYSVTNGSGNVNVAGSSVTTPVQFTRLVVTFTVTFKESGLASGTNWSVTFDGNTTTSTAPSTIAFVAANGTYGYSVGAILGFAAAPAHGNVTVFGSPPPTTVTFTLLFKTGTASIQHVVVIVMESKEVTKIWTTTQAPYQKYLSNTFGNVSSFYGICGTNGLASYEAMTSGQVFGCTSSTIVSAKNIADLLEPAGFTWGAYFESMPTACDRSAVGSYATNHNPFIHYSDVFNNATRCDAHVVNSRYFNQSAANGTLPNFSYYVPNLQDDCHSSTLASCDTWLKNFLTPIINSTSPAERAMANHTAFLITYDAGGTRAGYLIPGQATPWCLKNTGQNLTACDGHILMSVVSPFSLGLRYATDATQYSLQSTVEWLFGLGSDGGLDGTVNFPAFTSVFSFTANGY